MWQEDDNVLNSALITPEKMAILNKKNSNWASVGWAVEENKTKFGLEAKAEMREQYKHAFIVTTNTKDFKSGTIVRGAFFINGGIKVLRVIDLPPVGSKRATRVMFVPFSVLDEVENVEFGRTNIIEPKDVVVIEDVKIKETPVNDKVSTHFNNLSAKDKIIYGTVIGLAIFGTLKIFKLL